MGYFCCFGVFSWVFAGVFVVMSLQKDGLLPFQYEVEEPSAAALQF